MSLEAFEKYDYSRSKNRGSSHTNMLLIQRLGINHIPDQDVLRVYQEDDTHEFLLKNDVYARYSKGMQQNSRSAFRHYAEYLQEKAA